MTAKGTSGHSCCCGGCGDVPWGDAIPSAEVESERTLQPLPMFCCACLPKIICVTYSGCGLETRAILYQNKCLELPYGLDAYGGTGFSGNVALDGDSLDILVHFAVIGEECYVIISSVSLGISGLEASHRILLDDTNRNRICGSTSGCIPCTTCGYDGDDEFDDCQCLSWEIDSIPGCSYPVMFSACPASTTSLIFENKSACPGCYPLDPARPRCGTLCDGCTCICSEACITVSYQDLENVINLVTTERARLTLTYPEVVLDPYEPEPITPYGCDRITNAVALYETESGVVIQLRPNSETCECELVLLEWPYSNAIVPTLATTPEPVLIGGSDEDNVCPTPNAVWQMLDATDPTRSMTIVFTCATCKECVQVPVPQCCEFGSGSIPRVLTATIITGGDCCGTMSCALVYDGVDNIWYGTCYGIWAGGGPYCDKYIRLALSCGNPDWSMLATTDSECIPDGAAAANSGGSCEPVSLAFSFNAQGPGCCHEYIDPMYGIAMASFSVIVTE